MGYRSLACALAMGCAVTGCASSWRGIPLYSDGPRKRDEVALLVGPITSVDGEDVPQRGHGYELVPGCHIVQIGGEIGGQSPNSAWIMSFPHLTYAIDMHARNRYTIEDGTEAAIGLAPSMAIRVLAREEDENGHVRVLQPADSVAEIEKCRP